MARKYFIDRSEYKTKTDKIKFRLSSITKYLDIHDKNINIFTKNAKDKYFTSGLKLHMIYESYHFAAAAYFGKRTFAIMNFKQNRLLIPIKQMI